MGRDAGGQRGDDAHLQRQAGKAPQCWEYLLALQNRAEESEDRRQDYRTAVGDDVGADLGAEGVGGVVGRVL